MSRRKDLTEQRFGRLLVQEMHWEVGKATRVTCLCDCGKRVTVWAKNLPQGITTSCGCFQKERTSTTKRKDLTGQRFGRLVVEAMQYEGGKEACAHCRCDCGGSKAIQANKLRRGHTRSCGCWADETKKEQGQARRKDLGGQRFGRLVVEAMQHETGKRTRAHCRCDCGQYTTVQVSSLRGGFTTSCGCWQQEQRGTTKRKDLTGQRFGRLVVEAMQYETGKRTRASCHCDCGQTIAVLVSSLRGDHTSSCGCFLQEQRGKVLRKDLTGQRFGRLVVEAMQWGTGKDTRAHCRCDCGQYTTVQVGNLRGDHTTSCGCLMRRTAEEKRAVKRLAEHRRRARERGLPDHFERTHELFMQGYWQDRCALCGASADFWHVIAWDHWIPVTAPTCPGTVPGNILPMCHARKGAHTLGGPPACNNSKGNREPATWLLAKLGPRKGKAKLRAIERYFAAATAFAAEHHGVDLVAAEELAD